jgi:hypothetical protein
MAPIANAISKAETEYNALIEKIGKWSDKIAGQIVKALPAPK